MNTRFLKNGRLAPRCASLAATLLALGLSTPALAADAPADSSKCQVHSLVLPVRVVGDRAIATLKLNGESVPMLLDSGAAFSMLSEPAAKRLDLPLRDPPGFLTARGVTGEIKALKATRVKSVELEGEVIRDVDFLVGGNDLSHGMVGLLGRNLLAAADTEYDLAHGVVRLMFPTKACQDTSMAYWAGGAPVIEVPLIRRGSSDHSIRVAVKVNDRKVDAIMDSGASVSVLTIGTARRAGVAETDMEPSERASGAGANLVRTWMANVARFEFGGEKVTNNRFPIVDMSSDDQGMMLGLDYFLSHRIYVSRLQGKVYATWNGGAVFSKLAGEADQYDQRFAAKAEAIADDDADGLARRGNALLSRGDAARALADLDRAIQIQPTALHFEARSRAKIALKQSAGALSDLDEALRLDPSLVAARLLRVQLRMAAGDKAGARTDLSTLDAALAPSAQQRLQLAVLHAGLDDGAESIRQYDAWIQTHPQDVRLAMAHGRRCWMRAQMNVEMDKAFEDCKKAEAMDKGDTSARTFLGWIYLRTGDLPQSIKAFDASIKISSTPWALYGRGLARLRAGDVAAGQADIDAARRGRPTVDADAKRMGLDVAPGAPLAVAEGSLAPETDDL